MAEGVGWREREGDATDRRGSDQRVREGRGKGLAKWRSSTSRDLAKMGAHAG